MEDNPYRATQPRDGMRFEGDPLTFREPAQARNAGPEGLGGWLVLPAIGLGVTILRLAIEVARTGYFVIGSDEWGALTTPGSELYHPLFKTLGMLELVGNSLFAIFAAVLLVLYFMRSFWFPRLFIAFVIANLAFLVLDTVLAAQIPLLAGEGMTTMITEIVRTLVGAAIWVPYMLLSTRVANTFARRRTRTPSVTVPAAG